MGDGDGDGSCFSADGNNDGIDECRVGTVDCIELQSFTLPFMFSPFGDLCDCSADCFCD